MKKLLCTFFAVLLAVSVYGCGKSSDNVKNDAEGEATEIQTENKTEENKETVQMPTFLSNSYYRLTHDKELNVAYIGGSITQGAGASSYDKSWVALTTQWLSEQFPDANINENNSGISNTGSNYGIFRLREDIINVAVPDLIFIEFTSNDWGRFGELNISRQNESIIRKLYEVNPKMDIVFLFTSFSYDNNCRRASTALANHYNLMIIDPGADLKTRIDKEEGGVYDKYSPDKIHPSDLGHAIYLEHISEQFSEYLTDKAPENPQYLDFEIPEPLNKNGLFMNPDIIEPILLNVPADFEYKKTDIKLRQKQYDHYVGTDVEGAEYTFSFEGTGFGLLVYKTAKVSDIMYSVDGGEYVDYAIGDMHNYNHLQMYIMEYDLEPGKHTVNIKNKASQYGTAFNILGICINK